MFDCPQCSFESEEIYEGYCKECCEENQKTLDQHNFEFDRWESMTDAQRDNDIKRAIV